MRKKSSFKEYKKTKIQLTWKNVTITAKHPKKRCTKPQEEQPDLVILDDLSGTVKPGQFLAIIGASGAGKTTFLNFLSGKDPSKNLEKKGQVLINGVERSKVSFSQYVGYIQQDDVLMQTLTVRECLMFAAKMKLPPKTNIEEKVDSIIDNLKLNKAKDTKIGGPLVKGVSGGERKRTSIGVELITDPSLIFLDEPTTGLDSYTASHVVEILSALALSGRTIISTIHQPNSEAFEHFDQLMLMAQGRIIYQNRADLAINYFDKIGYTCPDRTNPADYFMHMMSIEGMDEHDHDTDNQEDLHRTKTMIEEDYKAKILELSTKYEQSEYRNDPDIMHPEVEELSQIHEKFDRIGVLTQFWYLLARALKDQFRLPFASYVKFVTNIIIAVIAVLVYGKLGTDYQSIQNRNGVLFFIIMGTVMNSVTNVTLIFPDERPVFLREQGARLYNPIAYFFAKFLSQMPVALINLTVYF